MHLQLSTYLLPHPCQAGPCHQILIIPSHNFLHLTHITHCQQFIQQLTHFITSIIMHEQSTLLFLLLTSITSIIIHVQSTLLFLLITSITSIIIHDQSTLLFLLV
jgi:hypothetical protein